MCQKSGEISLLKQQLKESQSELVQKGSELVALRVALREARAALRVSEGRARGLQEAARTRELELEACSQELQRHRQEAERLREKAGQLDSEAAGLREPPVPPATADPFLHRRYSNTVMSKSLWGLGVGAPETGRLRPAETLVLEASGASGVPQGGPARLPGRGI